MSDWKLVGGKKIEGFEGKVVRGILQKLSAVQREPKHSQRREENGDFLTSYGRHHNSLGTAGVMGTMALEKKLLFFLIKIFL